MRNISNVLSRNVAVNDDDWWKHLKVKEVEVMVYTTTDNKDDGEEVTLRVLYGPFEAKLSMGKGEFPDQDTRSVTIPLKPQPPLSASFSLNVRKEPQGSPTGHQWNALFEMTAITVDDSRAPLGSKSVELKFGDGNEYDRIALENVRAKGV